MSPGSSPARRARYTAYLMNGRLFGWRLPVDKTNRTPCCFAGAASARVPLVDRAPLLAQALRIEPERHRHALGVVGDGDVLVPERPRGIGHLGDRPATVGRLGVHLQVAAHVAQLDELGEPMLARQRDLAARLAQLRRDPIEAQRVVDLRFGLPRDPPGASE